jgi:hypothetical protein
MNKSDIPRIKASLAAPELPEAVNGAISLKNVPAQGMSYVVPEYEGMKEGHVVTARFGVDGDNNPFDFKFTVERPASRTVLVPRQVLLELTGKKAVAVYWIETGGLSLRTEVQVTH